MKKAVHHLAAPRRPFRNVNVTSEAGAYSETTDREHRPHEGEYRVGFFRIRKALKLRSGAKKFSGPYAYEVGEGKPARASSKVHIAEKVRFPEAQVSTHVVVRLKGHRGYYAVVEVAALPRVSAKALTVAQFVQDGSPGKSTTTRRRQQRLRADTAARVDDPLAAARARGRRYALKEYDSPDNLALLDARDYAGRNERSINEQRQAGQLYALLQPGKIRGFRYPKWQFDAEADRLKAVLEPFTDGQANCWVIHSFMMRKREALGGRSPADVVLDKSEDIKSVVQLAKDDLAGEQGAQ